MSHEKAPDDAGEGVVADAVQPELVDNRHTRAEAKLIERAIRNKWDIPESMMAAVPAMMAKVLRRGSAREKIAAARVLVAMHESNKRDDRPANPPTINVGVKIDNGTDEVRSRVAAIAERLRLGSVPAGSS